MKSAAQHHTAIPPLLIALALACFGLLAQMRAAPQVTPAPGGCYPNFTTAEGCNALHLLGNGAGNTGVGWYSLFSVGDANYNTGVGAGTLVLNTGDSNTAVGAAALLLNTTGGNNTAVGADALVHNDTGGYNTAIGDEVLFNNTSGYHNVAVGGGGLLGPALFHNTTGFFNTAVGEGALFSNIGGNDNTAIGAGALANNIDSNRSVAVGLDALNNSTGSNNVALGYQAGFNQTTGSNNIYIGYQIAGTAGQSNACYIGSIFGQTSSFGTPVLVNADHKLGTIVSSKRFKEDIKPMAKASEALYALEPVTFHYKKEIDPVRTSQLGLVAEDVEKVNPDLVVRDKEGKPYSVRYDQVNAMLLNEFLKEHRKVEEQTRKIQEQEASISQLTTTVAQQRKRMEVFAATLKEQASQIHKVKAQIDPDRPAPQQVVLKTP